MSPDHQSFAPPRSLANPHLQTVLSSVGRKLWQPPAHAAFNQAGRREIFEIDGIKLAVELNLKAGQPLLMLIPGWLGSAQSSYVLSAGATMAQKDWSVARINLRDHGDTAHLNPGLFNSALLDEVVGLIRQLIGEFGQAGAALMGFSLGGNFALRIARQLTGLPTLAVCPAIEPADTMYGIDRNLIYQRYFVRKWRKVWAEKQVAFPEHYDFTQALRLNSVSALTDYFVKYHSDFDSTANYFNAYDLSDRVLEGVSAHILAAQDDPIIPAAQYLELPGSLSVHLTERGGHGAYLESWGLSSWADAYAAKLFSKS